MRNENWVGGSEGEGKLTRVEENYLKDARKLRVM